MHKPVHAPVSLVARSKEKARANYNRLSRWYDIIAGSTEKKYRDIGLQKLAVQPGEQVLEIGFGTGHCILALAQTVGENGQVYGVDLSEGMLTITQDRLRQAGLLNRVDLRVGDAAELPFASGAFDGVFMSCTLELFDSPEIPVVLNQCYQVLKPGGRLVVVSLIKKAGTAVKIYEWFHEKMPVAVDCRPIYAQADLTAAGFNIQEVAAMSMWGLPVEIILAQREESP
jgi:demethylmenaquinone methyltransferase/2-methoxy-6-polyprenyl-1,4-benzoquinol methylase